MDIIAYRFNSLGEQTMDIIAYTTREWLPCANGAGQFEQCSQLVVLTKGAIGDYAVYASVVKDTSNKLTGAQWQAQLVQAAVWTAHHGRKLDRASAIEIFPQVEEGTYRD